MLKPNQPDTDPNATDDEPVETGLNREFVTELVDQIAEGNKAVVAAVEAGRAPVPTVPATYEEQLAAHTTAKTEMIEKRAALLADGKYQEADELMIGWAQSAPRPQAADPATDPAYVSLQEAAVHRARGANTPLFEKYGDEIDGAIGKLPAGERVTDAGIQKALNTVRQNHQDDLIAEQVAVQTEKIREQMTSGVAPQNEPSPALHETDDTDLHGLSREERGLAASLEVPYADYKAQMIASEKPNRDGSYDILPPGKPQPGQF